LELLDRASFFASLYALDVEIGREVQARGCGYCGGPLHVGHYQRRPRGLRFELERAWLLRLSYSCGREGCRRRTTPVSVRFFGRKVYAAVAFVLLSAQATGPLTNRLLGEIERGVGTSVETLRRWRGWWRDRFVPGRFWRQMRARFSPPVPEQGSIAASILGRFGAAGDEAAVERCLRFVAPAAGGVEAESTMGRRAVHPARRR
jgi:hypothetical protein